MANEANTPPAPKPRRAAPKPAKAPIADAVDNDAEILEAVADDASPAKSKVKKAGSKAKKAMKKEAEALKGQATDKARAAAQKGKGKAVAAAGSVSTVLADAASSIDAQFGKQYGDYARTAQGKLDELVGTIDRMEVDEMVDSAREFVRKQPAIAVGVAAAAGFALVRLLKAGFDDE